MANTYSNTPVLSRIKIGNDYYYVKDADVRTIIDGYNNAIVTGSIGNITDNNESFVYAKNIKAYVDNLVAAGLVIVPVDKLPTASKETMGKLYLVPHSHEETSDIKDEYITYNKGTEEEPNYSWEKIGNTDIDLSKYVTDVTYSNKVLSQTKNGVSSIVHEFGDMADADTASGKLPTVDSASFNFTPAGTLNVTLKDSTTGTSINSTGSFTPTGSINGEAIKGGSITVALGDAATDSNAVVSTTAYTPAGEVTAPTITLTSTTKDVNVVKENGTLPTFVEGAFTPASISDGFFNAGAIASYSHAGFNGGSLGSASKDTFAKEGILASVGTGDDNETLIITNASTASAVTEQGEFTAAVYGTDTFNGGALPSIDKTKFNGGSKAEDTWNAGAMPTIETQSVMESATAKASAPIFTGTEASGMKVTGVTYKKQIVTSQEFKPVNATLSFSGNAGDVSVNGSYFKQEIDKKEFTGTATTGNSVTLVSSEKTITVKPE